MTNLTSHSHLCVTMCIFNTSLLIIIYKNTTIIRIMMLGALVPYKPKSNLTTTVVSVMSIISSHQQRLVQRKVCESKHYTSKLTIRTTLVALRFMLTLIWSSRASPTCLRNLLMFCLWSPWSWMTSPYSGCSTTVPLHANSWPTQQNNKLISFHAKTVPSST